MHAEEAQVQRGSLSVRGYCFGINSSLRLFLFLDNLCYLSSISSFQPQFYFNSRMRQKCGVCAVGHDSIRFARG